MTIKRLVKMISLENTTEIQVVYIPKQPAIITEEMEEETGHDALPEEGSSEGGCNLDNS